jgi:uncharacterized protein (DUF2249 family)
MNDFPPLRILQDTVFPFDARGIAKRFRHAAIFGALDVLKDGETMRFINDHEPVPLLNQLALRYGARVSVHYRQCNDGHVVIDFIKEE